MASTIEIAIGWNSLPSTPSSENSGVNTTMMISTAKNTGRPTSRAANMMRTAMPCRSWAES